MMLSILRMDDYSFVIYIVNNNSHEFSLFVRLGKSRNSSKNCFLSWWWGDSFVLLKVSTMTNECNGEGDGRWRRWWQWWWWLRQRQRPHLAAWEPLAQSIQSPSPPPRIEMIMMPGSGSDNYDARIRIIRIEGLFWQYSQTQLGYTRQCHSDKYQKQELWLWDELAWLGSTTRANK